jgi:hypothetical protein
MHFTEGFKNWTDIAKNIAIFGGIIIAIAWGGMSVWANIAESRVDTGPEPPSIKNAQYEFLIINTGQLIYSDSYEHPSDTVWLLHKFYVAKDNKFKLQKADLRLDEYLFGKIIMTDRAEIKLTPTSP